MTHNNNSGTVNKLFLSIILLFFTMESFSQKDTFGIVSYTATGGYKLIKNDNVLAYYKEVR